MDFKGCNLMSTGQRKDKDIVDKDYNKDINRDVNKDVKDWEGKRHGDNYDADDRRKEFGGKVSDTQENRNLNKEGQFKDYKKDEDLKKPDIEKSGKEDIKNKDLNKNIDKSTENKKITH